MTEICFCKGDMIVGKGVIAGIPAFRPFLTLLSKSYLSQGR